MKSDGNLARHENKIKQIWYLPTRSVKHIYNDVSVKHNKILLYLLFIRI
jgi:hypothetical protein